MRYLSYFCHLYCILIFATLPTSALAVRSSESDEPSDRPNILLIVSDDQGYGDLGCYGSEEVKTPHLDRLAAGGVRLTSFYVSWPACTPSRGSLLTGRYPQRNGTYDMFRNEAPDYGHKYSPEDYRVTWERVGGMDTREVFLPAVLEKAGYVSGIFGKWDLGIHRRYLPLQRGFDQFYGFVNTGIDYYTHERYGVPSMYRGNEPTTEDKGTYCTNLFNREALRFIEQNHSRPFFLYVAFNAPHMASSLDPRIRSAAQAPEEYKKLYPHLQEGYTTREVRGKQVEVPTPETRKLKHMASITCMDYAIGEMLDALDKHGVADNTLVVFLSDNGGSKSVADNGPLSGGKAEMFEGGIRVPCVVRWPARLRPGTVSEEFLTALEVFPTVLAAAGVAGPDDVVLDGFDMTGVLSGSQPSPRKEMFWQRRADVAARVGNWKWVDSKRSQGLFDLSTDIGEQHDRSQDQPAVLARLKTRLAAWQDQMAQAEPRGPFRDY